MHLRRREQVGIFVDAPCNDMDYSAIITIDPAKRSGQPCIRSLRITLQDVLEYLAAGMSAAEIVKDFPDLTLDDIRTCLAFAADQSTSRQSAW